MLASHCDEFDVLGKDETVHRLRYTGKRSLASVCVTEPQSLSRGQVPLHLRREIPGSQWINASVVSGGVGDTVVTKMPVRHFQTSTNERTAEELFPAARCASVASSISWAFIEPYLQAHSYLLR